MTTDKPEVVAWEVRTRSDPKTQFGSSDTYPEWAERDANLSITPLVRIRDYDEVVSSLKDLAEAAKELAEWCYFDVGADPGMTPGLEKIMNLLEISDA